MITRARCFSVCRRNWECLQPTQHSQRTHTRQMYWDGECLSLRRWKPPFILGRISNPNRTSNRTQNSTSEIGISQWLSEQMGESKSMCVCWFRFFCVGPMRHTPEAIEKWENQVEGIKLYSSYQDAVGIDGEAIEFEWKMFPGFPSWSTLGKSKKKWRRRESSQKSSQTGSSSCPWSMTLYGMQMMRVVFQIPEKPIIMQMLGWTLDTIGSKLRRKLIWKY